MADFGILQSPSFAQAALGGYAAGQNIRKQKEREAALQLYASNPDAGVEAALKSGDWELATGMEERADKQRRREAYAKIFGGQRPRTSGSPAPVQSAPTAQAMPMDPTGAQGGPDMSYPTGSPLSPARYEEPAAAPTAATPATAIPPVAGDSIISSGGLQYDQQALNEYFAQDPEGASQILDTITKMNKAQREDFGKRMEALSGVAAWLLSKPGPERRAALAQAAPDLMAQGFTAEQLNAFDPSDDNLNRVLAQAIGGKGMAEMAKDDRKFRADEDYRRESLDIQRQGLGVRQGALSLARQREGRLGAGDGSGSGGLSDMSTDALIDALRD